MFEWLKKKNERGLRTKSKPIDDYAGDEFHSRVKPTIDGSPSGSGFGSDTSVVNFLVLQSMMNSAIDIDTSSNCGDCGSGCDCGDCGGCGGMD